MFLDWEEGKEKKKRVNKKKHKRRNTISMLEEWDYNYRGEELALERKYFTETIGRKLKITHISLYLEICGKLN